MGRNKEKNNSSGKNLIYSTASSLTLGLLGTLLAKSIEFGITTTFMSGIIALQLELMNKFNKTHELHVEELSCLNSMHLNEAISALGQFDRDGNYIFADILLTRMDLLAQCINKSTHSHELILSGLEEIRKVAITLAESAEQSLKATCLWKDNPLKHEGYEDLYLRLLLDQNIPMKRIFLVTHEDVKSNGFRDRFEKERNENIDVRFLTLDKWTRFGTEPNPIDFAIWDNAMVWKYLGSYKAQLFSNDSKINQYQGIYDSIWDKANTDLPENNDQGRVA